MSRPDPKKHEHTEKLTKHGVPFTVVWRTPMKREAYAVIYFDTGNKNAGANKHEVPDNGHPATDDRYLGIDALLSEVSEKITSLQRVRNLKRR